MICRGIPTIIFLLFFYAYFTTGTQFWIAVLAISLVEGAYMMEIVKGGLLSIDRGSMGGCSINVPAADGDDRQHYFAAGFARYHSGADGPDRYAG